MAKCPPPFHIFRLEDLPRGGDMVRLGIGAVVALATLACAQEADQTATLAELMAVDRRFAEETGEHRADGWMNYVADDAVMFQNGRPVSGRDDVRTMMAQVFQDTAFSLDWEPRQANVSAGGDLGYTIGRYRATHSAPEGADHEETGSYVTIWRRQPDRSWLVVLDIGNPDTPEPSGANE